MNAEDNRTPRTTKKSAIVIVGVITLAIGVLIGLTVTKSSAGSSAIVASEKIPANQLSSVASSGLNPPNPVEWNPFQEFRDLQAQMDQMFDRMLREPNPFGGLDAIMKVN